MRSNLVARVLLGVAVTLFSIFVAASGAYAVAPEATGDGGESAEHRKDADAQAQRDDRRTSEPAQRASATIDQATLLDEPQPASNADFSGNGANNHGSYDSTRDGSASANGNGGGAAIGKPCAGCVGKADNKNPPGQFRDGSDPNNGYECDGNSGIGKTNPAHTGCVAPSTPNAPTVQATGTEVLGVVFTAPAPAVAPAVLSSAALAPTAAAALATTGSGGLLPLAAFGFALVLAGAMLRTGAARRAA